MKFLISFPVAPVLQKTRERAVLHGFAAFPESFD
jgi:hypothetical protein